MEEFIKEPIGHITGTLKVIKYGLFGTFGTFGLVCVALVVGIVKMTFN